MLRVQSLLHCIGLAVQNAMADGPSSDMSWSQHLNEIAEGTWESGRLELAGDRNFAKKFSRNRIAILLPEFYNYLYRVSPSRLALFIRALYHKSIDSI